MQFFDERPQGLRIAQALPLLALAGIYLWHLGVVWRYSVDIPFWDEWDVWWTWPGTSLPDWLLERHNEHRILITRLQIFLSERFGSGDVAGLQKLNFLIFAAVPAWFLCLAGGRVPEISVPAMAGFSLFLLSPLSWENHSWAFQSQFHFTVLFLLGASALIFDPRGRVSSLVAGALLAVLAPLTFSAGVAGALAIAGLAVLYWMQKKRPLRGLAIALPVGISAVLCASGYRHLPGHPPLVLPLQKRFWSFFLNLVNVGFGYNQQTIFWGLFCLALVLYPLAACAWKRRGVLKDSEWTVTAATLCVLAVIATIAMGRGAWGGGMAKSSRYTEFALLLVPLSAAGWAIYLASRPRIKHLFLAGLWIYCFVNFLNDWGTAPYARMHEARVSGMHCVEKYFSGKGNGNCPTIYPVSLDTRLQRVKVQNGTLFRRLAP